MNTDTNYNKLEIIVTRVGDFTITYREDSNSKCWNRVCRGIGKKMLEETFRDLSEGSWWLYHKHYQAAYRLSPEQLVLFKIGDEGHLPTLFKTISGFLLHSCKGF